MAEANALTDRQREYREVYLRSEHWRFKRQQALAKAEHRCQVCYGDEALDVHHRTYQRLGEERLSDLTVLCRPCHDLFHESGRLVRGPQKRFGEELSQRSVEWIRQAVPEPQVMWLRTREFLRDHPWSTASDVQDVVVPEDPRTYDDWAYRVLERACLDGFVQRRNVPWGQRYRVQWALVDPPKRSSPNRRKNSKKRRKEAAKKRSQPRKGDLARELVEMKARNARRGAA